MGGGEEQIFHAKTRKAAVEDEGQKEGVLLPGERNGEKDTGSPSRKKRNTPVSNNSGRIN